ncbi:MAG: DUF3095 domain-containing protein [Pseudomonadota bacterium]
MTQARTALHAWFEAITPFTRFSDVTHAAHYRAAPDDALFGITDVVNSTASIDAGRYKAVNVAGAAAISALMNALDGRPFPFVFGGDGASFLVDADDEALARHTLGATAAFVRDNLDLELRCGLYPLAQLRADGHDVRVARYAPSPHVSYAMITGGGARHAETQLKAGIGTVAPADSGVAPDLTGLSCRWQPLAARRGVIASVIVEPTEDATPASFAAIANSLLERVSGRLAAPFEDTAGGPDGVTPQDASPALDALRFGPDHQAQDLEIAIRASDGRPRDFHRRALRRFLWIARTVFAFGLKVGAFDPRRYRAVTATNTDFRKFDDGLRMTLDCAPDRLDAIEAYLAEARAAGLVRYGIHRQQHALMTCIVPAQDRDDHMHFLDGAGGGYAQAAANLKRAGDHML